MPAMFIIFPVQCQSDVSQMECPDHAKPDISPVIHSESPFLSFTILPMIAKRPGCAMQSQNLKQALTAAGWLCLWGVY